MRDLTALKHVDKSQKEKFREIDAFFASGFYTGYRNAVAELGSDPAPYIPAMGMLNAIFWLRLILTLLSARCWNHQ